MGAELNLLWTSPFAGMLLAIALCPLFAPHWWHHHFPKVSLAFALLAGVPLVLGHGKEGMHELVHIMVLDYVPFLILLAALFIISGGILVTGTLAGTPWVNTILMLIGTALASWIGTTGASMLLIRPLLRANSRRRYKAHTVVFFIFLVSNIGGSLTPLGDPPLFLGFLHSVPFFWTLTNCLTPMLLATAIVLGIYVVFDWACYARESAEVKLPAGESDPVRIRGLGNFVLLAGVVGGVLLSGYWKPDLTYGAWIRKGEIVILEEVASHGGDADPHSAHAPPLSPSGDPHTHAKHAEPEERPRRIHGVAYPIQNLARDLLLVLMAGLSMYVVTPRGVREENGFTWFPIWEVAVLFFGIFMTIIPALAILKAGEAGALGFLIQKVDQPWHFFWMTGGLSSFLDNAPTYLTFFNTALGRFYPELMQAGKEAEAVRRLIADQNVYLQAIALGAVFMGANTYIGNAPNFMVKSIAEEADVRMPSFPGYMLYSLAILIPTFALITWVFFRG